MPDLDQDKACPHEDFSAVVDVSRLQEEGEDYPHGYNASIWIECAACREPFRWIGVMAGLSGEHPMVNAAETELRAPIRPASSDPDFGLGIPGFAIQRVVPPDE